MVTFAFLCLTLLLFAFLVALGYVHLKRENERTWKRYRRRTIIDVRRVEARVTKADELMAAHIEYVNTALKMTKPQSGALVGFPSMNPRARSEDRHEAELAQIGMINKKPIATHNQ